MLRPLQDRKVHQDLRALKVKQVLQACGCCRFVWRCRCNWPCGCSRFTWCSRCARSFRSAAGAQGPSGAVGAQGPSGAAGAQGLRRRKTAPRAQRVQGPSGAGGVTGSNGVPGATGNVGATGAIGPSNSFTGTMVLLLIFKVQWVLHNRQIYLVHC